MDRGILIHIIEVKKEFCSKTTNSHDLGNRLSKVEIQVNQKNGHIVRITI